MRWKAIVPSIFTFTNGISGMAAIIAAASGAPLYALCFVILALICDGLDGFTARALGVPSEFGVQYDTANDCITFAIAPAVIAYFALLPLIGVLAFLPAAIYAGCAIFRLARFNALKTEKDAEASKSTYDGMPSTGGAMVMLAAVFGSAYLALSPNLTISVIAGSLVLAGLLMVSTFQYGVLKHVIAAPWQFHLLVSAPLLVLAFVSWPIALMGLATIYAFHGPVLSLLGWQKSAQEAE